MLDIGERHEHRIAIVARELPGYNIDIAALQETRLAGECQLEEVGDGYKFFFIGHPEGQPRQAGIGLIVIRTTLLSHMVSQPHGISPGIMTMPLQLEHGRSMVLISCAPIFLTVDHDKEAFCDYLNSTIRLVPFRHRLLLCDFNVRIGHDCHIVAWPNVFFSHSVGRENSDAESLTWPNSSRMTFKSSGRIISS